MTYQYGAQLRPLAPARQAEVRGHQAAGRHGDVEAVLRLDRRTSSTARPTRKNGAIVAADFYYNERARREFTSAMIKELTFPKLDAQDKNAAYMTSRSRSRTSCSSKGDGKKLGRRAGLRRARSCGPRATSGFALDGFEQACRRVTKIDSFTIKQNVARVPRRAAARRRSRRPSQIEFPNIAFYVPEADAQPFIEHFNKRAVIGEREQRGRSVATKTGTLADLRQRAARRCSRSSSSAPTSSTSSPTSPTRRQRGDQAGQDRDATPSG